MFKAGDIIERRWSELGSPTAPGESDLGFVVDGLPAPVNVSQQIIDAVAKRGGNPRIRLEALCGIGSSMHAELAFQALYLVRD